MTVATNIDVAGEDRCHLEASLTKENANMTRQRRLLLASLVAAWVVMVLACGGAGSDENKSGPRSVTSENSGEKTIPYEVLEHGKRVDGKLIMSVLVSEAASKADVMKLADSLQRQHAGTYATISIFDSREAWRRQLDKTYPEDQLSRHWLVVIVDEQANFGQRTKDHQEIRWVAEGRVTQEEKAAEPPKRADAAQQPKKEDKSAESRKHEDSMPLEQPKKEDKAPESAKKEEKTAARPPKTETPVDPQTNAEPKTTTVPFKPDAKFEIVRPFAGNSNSIKDGPIEFGFQSHGVWNGALDLRVMPRGFIIRPFTMSITNTTRDLNAAPINVEDRVKAVLASKAIDNFDHKYELEMTRDKRKGQPNPAALKPNERILIYVIIRGTPKPPEFKYYEQLRIISEPVGEKPGWVILFERNPNK